MTLRHICAVALLGATAARAQAFCDKVKGLAKDPSVAAAHWGVSVTALDGTVLCSLNEAQLFRPASNNKLFTMAAALALLGPDKTADTQVTGKFDAATGAVKGDLTLVGAGDANLDSGDLPYARPAQRAKNSPPEPFAFHDLEDLAAQLAAKGVKRVDGDVVGDDWMFPWERFAEAWSADDLVWGYGAPVSALSIADNQLRLTVTPIKIPPPGRGIPTNAVVALDQHGVPYYTVRSEVGTVPAHTPAGITVERLPGSRVLRVVGSITEDAPPAVEEVSIDDPALYAATAFRQILIAHGIAVRGQARADHDEVNRGGPGFLTRLRAPLGPETVVLEHGLMCCSCLMRMLAPTLAVHHSAPLQDDVVFTAKTSQNLHAELMLHRVGHLPFCSNPSTVEGVRMVRAFLIRSGIAAEEWISFDGSGLSTHDLTTPNALTQLLGFAAKQTWFDGFKAALPVGGVDGSLASRFTGPASQVTGKVFAKTGTLGESRALSGYVTAASGKTIVFSVMVDNHPPGTAADRIAMDKMVEAIAAGN